MKKRIGVTIKREIKINVFPKSLPGIFRNPDANRTKIKNAGKILITSTLFLLKNLFI